jgi:hypothetical protein
LSEQEQRLSDLRTRAGTILAAASIAGSFLAAKNGSIDTPAVRGGLDAAYEAVTECCLCACRRT